MNAPPGRWRDILRHVLPTRDRNELLAEIDLLFESRLESEGRTAADRWYRAQVLHFVRRYPLERIRPIVRGLRSELRDGTVLLRQIVRGLVRTPGFTFITVTTLGLGIGSSAVIVGITDRALLRPLPFPESNRLVSVLDGWAVSLGTLEILQREMTTVEMIGGAVSATGMTLATEGRPARRMSVASVSPEYLSAIRVAPTLGRIFTPEEAQPGQGQVVLLSDHFWRTELGGTTDVLERSLVLDGLTFRVVGVLPTGFDQPSDRNDLWRPATMDASNPGLHWGAGNHTLVARLSTGATPEMVREELLDVQEQVRTANPLWTPNPGFWNEAQVAPLGDARSRWVRTPLLVLLGAVGMVLLVVCANVTSLFLSRGLARQRDYAVRSALGAGRGRLAREQLFEALVIGTAGLAFGLLLASLGLQAIRPFLPAEIPGAAEVGLDLRVILMTSAVAFLMAVGAGAFPALRTAGIAPARFLQESARGGGVSRARRRTTRWLVAGQLAAAIVLVASAGLLARTLAELSRVEPGFEPDSRITARLHLPPGLPDDPSARAALLVELEDRLLADGALTGVSLASTIPFGAEDEYVAIAIDGITTDPNDLPVLPHHRVSSTFFDVAGIPLLGGRRFERSDLPGTPLVAIVDETFVHRFLPGDDPIGRVIRYPWRGAPPIEIIGVVGSTSHGDLAEPPQATVWVPLTQMGMGTVGHAVVVSRVAGGTESGLGAIAARTREFDERIAVSNLATYEQLLGASLADTWLVALLLSVFAAGTLLLGCVGVYGVAAFSVRERFREIGVRMAMGASTGRVRRSVLRDGLGLTLPGGALGLLLSIPATRALEGLLYGVAPFDLVTFAAAPVILAVAALIAVYVPAARATRVDPAEVLRGD